MSLTVDVLNTKGKKIESMDLEESVFDVKSSKVVIHEVVNAYLANRRRGTHSTKTRAEVSGGGGKPWKQKGTGRARSGSTRSPLWRHGGVTFGPKPRSYYQAISPTKRKLALKSVLSDYRREGRLSVIDSFEVKDPKTKQAVEIIKKIKAPKKSIFVLDQINDTTWKAVRNVEDVQVCLAKDLNSYGVLLAEKLIFTKTALEEITKRLEKRVKLKEEGK